MTTQNNAPSTRIISWQQLVIEADPNFRKDALRPWVYDFSNGRLFYWRPDVYTTTST